MERIVWANPLVLQGVEIISSPELDLLDPLANDGIMSAADSRYDLTMDALEPEITDVPGFFVTVELYAGR